MTDIEQLIHNVHRQVLAGELTPQEADWILALAEAELEAELRRVEIQIRKEREG